MIISYRFSSNKDIGVKPDLFFLPLPWVKVVSLCLQVMSNKDIGVKPDLFFLNLPWVKVVSLCLQVIHSCITLEIMRSMDLLILLPNLLHSMTICLWLACSMSICILASLFTIILVVGAWLPRRKKIFGVFSLPNLRCVSGSSYTYI